MMKSDNKLLNGFVQIPNQVWQDTSISHVAVRVYGCLLHFSTLPYGAHPKIKTIGAKIGANEQTTRNALHSLRDAGYITIHEQKGQCSIYEITPLSKNITPDENYNPTPPKNYNPTPPKNYNPTPPKNYEANNINKNNENNNNNERESARYPQNVSDVMEIAKSPFVGIPITEEEAGIYLSYRLSTEWRRGNSQTPLPPSGVPHDLKSWLLREHQYSADSEKRRPPRIDPADPSTWPKSWYGETEK